MKPKLLITTLLTLAAVATTGFAADDAKKKKKAGGGKAKATSLFDGKSLDGWHRGSVGEATYKVEDGAIVGTTTEGSPNTFLLSDNQYGDFILEFQVKVDDGLNSGVQIRSREKTAEDVAAEAEAAGKKPNRNAAVGRLFGPQVEIEKSPGQSGYIYGEATGFGWLSPEPADKDHAHEHIKNGEWNHYKVMAKGPRIQTWINGEKVADLTHEEIYESHPKGHLGLQVHGIKAGTGPYQASWKDITIKELD
ncbi:MAG: DUF1080 domain-containing protein [Verrucomicrobiota bacterium]